MRCRLYKRREKFWMKRKMDERLTLDDEQISWIKSNLHYTGCFFPVITECVVTFRAVTERRPCWNADPSGNPCKETLRAALSLVDLYPPPFASELWYRRSFASSRRPEHSRIGQHGMSSSSSSSSPFGRAMHHVFLFCGPQVIPVFVVLCHMEVL